MVRTALVWGLPLALFAFGLAWLDFQQARQVLPPDVYAAIVAMLFAAGGLWAGWRIAARRHGPSFVRNEAAVRSLRLTGQELRVLERLASGQSNKALARNLGLSPNTVKTHLANLFAKLEVVTRTEAVTRARDLAIIP